MSEFTSEALRAWFKRVEPFYPELFNIAHAICGNYELAEYALRCAIVDVWSDNADGSMGFREKLRTTLKAEAIQATLDEENADAEFTWPGFTEDDSGPIQMACRERIELQRALMLKYGVGLPVKRIAQIIGVSSSEARTALDRFEARCRRSLPAQESGRYSALITQASRRQLAGRSNIPHPASVYRAFQAEVSGLQVSEHRVSKLIYRLLALVMALVCAGLFWLFAVLMQAPASDSEPTAVSSSVSPSDGSRSIETTYQTEASAR